MDIDERLSASALDDRPFRRLVQGILDYAIYLLSPDGIVMSWNAGAAAIKGYGVEEAIGQHFGVFYTPEDRARNLPETALAIAARDGRYEAEGWRVRKDGARFWANVVIDRLKDEDGNLIGFAKIARDSTERRAAQEALRQSEERFSMLVQGVTDYAIYMLDPTGHVTNWNAGGHRIKGYTAEEILGQHFSVFYTNEDRAAGLPQRALAIAEEVGRYEAEGPRVRKDGTTFWAGVVIDPIRDQNGKLLGFAKVTRDLTASRASEAQLRQSQKMEAIGQLTGGIAHDFNNLLTVVASNADLLLHPELREGARRKLVEGIQRAAERGAKLTQQLLAFARRQPLQPRTHSVRALIGNFESVLRHAAGETLELEFDLYDGPDMTCIDAAQFEASLLNLVVNARDAMPQSGTIKLRTAIERIDASAVPGFADMLPGQYVVVTIEDEGSGMEEHAVARAFEPFYTTKEIGKGSGLGLSQVHGFVAQSGGGVSLQSSVGQGTTVTLYLRVDADAQQLENARAEKAKGERAATVLVVEDDADVREAAISMLSMLGFEVMTADDGPSALDSLRRERPIDILFTDISMPHGMNGVELARQAREIHPGIKVLLASGYPMSLLSAEHGLTSDFAFISKPYRWSELSERLRPMLPA